MKRLLRIFFIVACLAGVAYSLFHSPCPPAHRIIAQWEEDAADYHAGRISFDELIYRSDRLIECSEKLRERLESQPQDNCNRKTHRPLLLRALSRSSTRVIASACSCNRQNTFSLSTSFPLSLSEPLSLPGSDADKKEGLTMTTTRTRNACVLCPIDDIGVLFFGCACLPLSLGILLTFA